MHSGIAKGHKLLCDAHTVLEKHMGTAVFFVLLIVLFRFFCLYLCHSDSLFLFLGASIVGVYNNLI